MILTMIFHLKDGEKKHKEKKYRKSSGFTMGEMVIVIAIIAILAALITPLAVNIIEQKRVDACIEELNNIKKAFVGDASLVQGGTRSSFGFVGDLGILPANLGELVTNSQARPVYQQYGATGMFYGWRGPYVNEFRDPWGNDYNYLTRAVTNTDKRIALIWSSGQDGQTDADPLSADTRNTDNILISINQDEAFSMVSGNTLDQCDACSPFTNISISYPNGTGVVSTANKTTTAANPVYVILGTDTSTGLGIPIGIRAITFATATPTVVNKLIQVNNGPMVTMNIKDPGPCIN
jgi:prepilin-type N-terminal cleavage/methylation domain-containing protein